VNKIGIMQTKGPTNRELFKTLINKGGLKQDVFHKTQEVFRSFKKEAEALPALFRQTTKPGKYPILFEFQDRGEFEFELKFGGDVLIFMMHTNVFEFPRDHEVMKTPYVKEDSRRSYTGVIMIYNFLNDSFRYNRINDIGYLIGRIFVNRELHYFVEGKREVGLLYNNFNTSTINQKSIRDIIRSAMMYTINFDLLTPEYDRMKEVTVAEIQDAIDKMMIRTAKRLGYRFQADKL
jgi:hypothetical protein